MKVLGLSLLYARQDLPTLSLSLLIDHHPPPPYLEGFFSRLNSFCTSYNFGQNSNPFSCNFAIEHILVMAFPTFSAPSGDKALYSNNYSLIINIYFYETVSTSSQNLLALALNSLDTLSDVRKKAVMFLF